ncbi:hypothetical protein ACFYTG_54130 [Streptomyces mirabilis]|uniref:hypothetical protein n=1 Tax=Streptomyces mirabilis TaxID=68239 RepID=UPI00367DA9EB
MDVIGVGQIAAGRVSGRALIVGETAAVGFGTDVGDSSGGVAGQDPGRLGPDPGLGFRIGGGVEATCGRPELLDHVDDIEHDVDSDVATGGFGVELVGDTVDQDHPVLHHLRDGFVCASHDQHVLRHLRAPATTVLFHPRAHASTIRARFARPCAVVRRLAQFSNTNRSASDSTSGSSLGSPMSPGQRSPTTPRSRPPRFEPSPR